MPRSCVCVRACVRACVLRCVCEGVLASSLLAVRWREKARRGAPNQQTRHMQSHAPSRPPTAGGALSHSGGARPAVAAVVTVIGLARARAGGRRGAEQGKGECEMDLDDGDDMI